MIGTLTALIFLPALGALAIALLRGDRSDAQARRVALTFSFLTLLLGVWLFLRFELGEPGMQFLERAPWIPALGVQYLVGVDGISLFLVLLTVVLVPLLLLVPWEPVRGNYRLYAAMVLLLETGLLGVFLALDLVLFYVFWEAMLIPMYFLIGVWGGERRGYAAMKFFLYTMATSVLMLVAIIVLYVQFGTFDLLALQGTTMASTLELWLFLAFAAAFAVKTPIWPFHSWLPDAYKEAPVVGTVLMAALMSKAGLYGFLRFGPTLFPNAFVEMTPYLIALALVGVLYGALVAVVQSDLKRMVAYSSLSHVGLVAMGVFAMSALSLTGSVLQMVSHGLVIAGVFLLLAILAERFGGLRPMDAYGGIMHFMPRLGALALVFVFANVALPGTSNFVGEFLILLGTFVTQYRVYAILGAFVAVLSAIYMLWMTQRVFHNPPREELQGRARDLTAKEVALLVPLVLLVLWIGIYPKPLLSRIEPSTEALRAQAQARVERTLEAVQAQAQADANRGTSVNAAPEGNLARDTAKEGGR